MTVKFAICDDNKTDLQYIQDLLNLWATERQISVQSECFSSAESFLFKYAEDKTYDVLLLDIEMGKMDGVTLAKNIRRENDTVQIVFITGYSEYIAEGYDVAALHYLMKPVNQDKLFTVLYRATEKILLNEKCLNLTLSGEMVRIPLHQIRYLDVHQNYVTIHGKQDYTVKRTLSELASMLDDRFFRAVRSLIVNLGYISRVSNTDVYLSDGSILPLPRGTYEALNRA
ncbi:MAG: response regulator transcription factor, partial [Lachnospiraceae bacterium]|nr:response regulator transcription factor [Lachnospiraceae bacterium]